MLYEMSKLSLDAISTHLFRRINYLRESPEVICPSVRPSTINVILTMTIHMPLDYVS
jgi:hypothetical protein